MKPQPDKHYLDPYYDGIGRHGGDGFGALLWASPQTQAARFDALSRLCNLDGRDVLDAGCGRADFLEYLLNRGIAPNTYLGLEAVEEFAAGAERKNLPRCRIVRGDFVKEPVRLFVGAEAVVFCGSLNTLSKAQFRESLARGLEAAGEVLLFNFLSSPHLAGAPWLSWHQPNEVRELFRGRAARIQMLQDYMQGDCTAAVWKQS